MMPISKEARKAWVEALRSLDTSHQHGYDDIDELRSRIYILVELARELLRLCTQEGIE